MPVRIGVISAAHVHAPSFAACFLANPDAEVTGLWDDQPERGKSFAEPRGLHFFDGFDGLLASCDAVVICSENGHHAAHIEAASAAGKAILCEKPLAARESDIGRIESAVQTSSVPFMTAFPCPFSPNFKRLQSLTHANEIGQILALTATNRGTCPYGWFVDPELSGGGAMIDHVVHVADLLHRLLGEWPSHAYAQVGSGMNAQPWEDVAKLTLAFPSGVFATLDSSWSRPKGYRIWGDVTLRATGTLGTMEADLFNQGLESYRNGHSAATVGSNLDALMAAEFLRAVQTNTPPLCTLQDGLMASRVALAGYRSLTSRRAESV